MKQDKKEAIKVKLFIFTIGFLVGLFYHLIWNLLH